MEEQKPKQKEKPTRKEEKEEPKEQKKEPQGKKEKPKEKEEKKEKKPKKEKPPKVKEKTKKEVEIPKKFKDLVSQIEELSVIDLSELVKILEKRFGVSASAPVAAAPQAPAEGEEPSKPPQKKVVNIELKEIGDKKIEVIKAVRDITKKGLKDAKGIVDAAAKEPQTVKENVKRKEAQEFKKKLEEAGAKVELS